MNNESAADRANKAVRWHAQTARLIKLLVGILFFSLLHDPERVFANLIPAGSSIALAWNANANPNVIGYNVYYGAASGDYTNMINVGNVTSTTISGLVVGATYYFSVTSYDSMGEQSDYSAEISYTVSTNLFSKMQIRRAPAGQFILTVTGPIGKTYNVQATQDFKTWSVLGTVTLDASGSLNFTDTNAANFPQRFYRTQEEAP